MAENVSDILVQTMLKWGIDTVFGLPGDGINGVIEALRKNQDKIRFIQVRHEEAAGFMACAYAKYTGRLGCCLSTSGPGGIHMLNGLYDAKMDGQPVLAITGQTFSDLQGSRYQQDVDLTKPYADVAVFNEELINPRQIMMLANEACRHALSLRGVAHLCLPSDYQDAPAEGKHSPMAKPGSVGSIWEPARLAAPASELDKAAEILNAAQKPAVLVGQGALGAGDEIVALADALGAPIVKSLLGKAVLPDDHPLTTGGIGLLGTAPSEDVMQGCDALLMIGTSFPYTSYLPDHEKTKGVQIDDKPERIGLRFPVDVGLVGDAKITVPELTQRIRRKTERSFLEKAQAGMKDWWALMEQQSTQDVTPLKPQSAPWMLSELADADAIVSSDCGTNTTWAARQFKIRKDQMFSTSGTLASMAAGMPYAIAAKIAFPERQSLAIVGDGGFSQLMAEFSTAVKYKLDITVVILKNNSLGQIKWEQIVFLGNPEYVCDLQDIDFAKFAEACGGVGYTVRTLAELRPALTGALSSGKPAVVEVYVDPNEPPMPGHLKPEQALHFAESLAKGTPGGPRIALTAFRDKIGEVVSKL